MKLLKYLSFFIFFLLVFLSCDLENPDEGIPVEDVITLTAEPSSIAADGKSRTELTALLGEASDPNLLVTFTTSNGTFLETVGEKTYSTAASGKIATATLVGTDIVDEDVVVVASVASINDASLIFKTSQSLSFTTAFPNDLLLSSNQTSISKTGLNDATLSAMLFRNMGSPSQDLRVDFKVIPLDTATVSITPFAFTGDNAIATTTVKSANLQAGKVRIIAETLGQNEAVLSDTLELNIVE